MSVAFKTVKLPSGQSDSVTFEGTVKSACAAVQGFSGKYLTKKGHPADHHLAGMDVSVSILSIDGGTVKVSGAAGFFDNSGEKSTGDITVLVVADLA